MKSENKPRNRIAVVLAILVLVVAGLSAYMVFLSPERADPGWHSSPHAIDQSN